MAKKQNIHPFLKLAGVKSEAAFYKKYATDEEFFKAHPMARYGYALKADGGTPMELNGPQAIQNPTPPGNINAPSPGGNVPTPIPGPGSNKPPVHQPGNVPGSGPSGMADDMDDPNEPNQPGTPPDMSGNNNGLSKRQQAGQRFKQGAAKVGQWAGEHAGDLWAGAAQLANAAIPQTPVRQNVNPYQMAINTNPQGTGSHAAAKDGMKMGKKNKNRNSWGESWGRYAADGTQMGQQPLNWDNWNDFHGQQSRENPQYGTDALNHGNFNNAALQQWNTAHPTQAIPQSDIVRYQQDSNTNPQVRKQFGPTPNDSILGMNTTGLSHTEYIYGQADAKGNVYYSEDHRTNPLAAGQQVNDFTQRAHDSRNTPQPAVGNGMPDASYWNYPNKVNGNTTPNQLDAAAKPQASAFPTYEQSKQKYNERKASGKKLPSNYFTGKSSRQSGDPIGDVRMGNADEAYTGTKMFPDSINRGKRNTYFDDPVKSIHMDNGGYMKMDAGGFSNTPIHIQGPAEYLSPESIELQGKSHAAHGQKIYANGTHVEAEGPNGDGTGVGEIVANEPRTGTPHVLGNLRTLPETAMKLAEMGVKVGNNMKHKEVGEIIAKAERKNDKMQTKVNYLLNTNQPGDKYQGPLFNSGRVLADAYAQNKVKTDTAKQLVMDDMNMQNDIAEKMGMDPKKVGNYMKDAQKLSAKYGVKMDDGGPMSNKLSMVAPQSRQEYVDNKYKTLMTRYPKDGNMQNWTNDDEEAYDTRGAQTRAIEGTHYISPQSYPINPRTLTPMYPKDYGITNKPQFTDIRGPQIVEEYKNGGPLYQPLEITPAMPTQHSQITPLQDIAPMTMRKDWANDGSAGGKPRSYITKSPTTIPGDMIFAAGGTPIGQKDNTPLSAEDQAYFEDLRKSNPEMFTEDYGQGRKNVKLPGKGDTTLWGPGYRNVKAHAGKYKQTPNPPQYESTLDTPSLIRPVEDDRPGLPHPRYDMEDVQLSDPSFTRNTGDGPAPAQVDPNALVADMKKRGDKKAVPKGIRNKARILDYLPEIMSGLDQIEPVQSLQARTNLEDTYTIDFQNEINDVNRSYDTAIKAAANNPGAQATLLAQKSEDLGKIHTKAFQYNQQNQGGIRGRNIERLDRRDAMNLQLDSQKLDRQAAAKEAHSQRVFGAAQSVSGKEAQRKAQNWMLGADEKATGYIIQDKDGNYHRIAPDHEYAYDGPYGISSLANDKSTTETKSWKDPKTGETWKKVTKDEGNGYYGGYMMSGGAMGGMAGGQMAMRGPSYFGAGGADTKKKKKRKS